MKAMIAASADNLGASAAERQEMAISMAMRRHATTLRHVPSGRGEGPRGGNRALPKPAQGVD
jgi:hypothetical protein